jgi:hypothetical protein
MIGNVRRGGGGRCCRPFLLLLLLLLLLLRKDIHERLFQIPIGVEQTYGWNNLLNAFGTDRCWFQVEDSVRLSGGSVQPRNRCKF